MTKKHIIFKVGTSLYMIDIDLTDSIVRKKAEEIKSIPDSPPWIRGITYLREKLIVILDSRIKFHSPNIEMPESFLIMVVKHGELKDCGIIVDDIYKILDIDLEDIKEPNSFVKNSNNSITGAYLDGDEIVLRLDAELAFKIDREVLESIKK